MSYRSCPSQGVTELGVSPDDKITKENDIPSGMIYEHITDFCRSLIAIRSIYQAISSFFENTQVCSLIEGDCFFLLRTSN